MSGRCPQHHTGPANIALLVLMPDAMAQDLWARLVRRLLPLRLEVLATTSVVLRPPLLTALYAHGTFKQARPGRSPSTWLSHGLAALDTSVPMVLRTSLEIDLAALLDAWKGSSTYGARRCGDLRSVAPAANRCFSVLHTPDDATQTAADIRTLFGSVTWDQIIEPDAPVRCTLPDLRRLRMPCRSLPPRHPYEIVHRCIVRAAALLAYDHLLLTTPEWTGFVDRCVAADAPLRAVEPKQLDEAWQGLTSALLADLPSTPEPAIGRRSGELRGRLDLFDTLVALLTPSTYGSESCEVVERAFDANDLFLDGWERHLLRVALSFHRS